MAAISWIKIYVIKQIQAHAHKAVQLLRAHTDTYKLFPHCNRVDLYKYFFLQRLIDTWNSSLPAKLNDFSNLARFTRFVRSADLSPFLSLGY